MQEFQPVYRPRILSYGLWFFAVVLLLALFGVVVALTLML